MRYIDHHAHMVSRTTDDYQQLALTGHGQLFPGRSHLFQLLPMRGRRGARHFPALGGVLTVFVEFSHANALPPPAFHIMSARRIRSRPAQKSRSVGGQRGTSEWQVPGPWSFHSQPHLVQPPRLAASKARPSSAANLAAASRVLMDRVAITRAYPIAPRPASAGAPKKAAGTIATHPTDGWPMEGWVARTVSCTTTRAVLRHRISSLMSK